MIVLSRDGKWLTRLEDLAARGCWPFEARAALPAAGRTPPPERVLVVLDRALAGAVVAKAVESLRALYPSAAVVVSCDDADLADAAVVLSCGADEILGKSWPDEKIASRLSSLRDRSLAGQARLSADGSLKAERRAHRVSVRARGKWKELKLDAGAFAILWRLLEREGELVSREDLGDTLAAAAGREREAGTVSRRLAALKKALAPWGGDIHNARGGLYRLESAPRRAR